MEESAVASLARTSAGIGIARVAVLIPCHNEEATVAAVVTQFRKILPNAEIWVFDNDSTDQTADKARQAGAKVRHVVQRGKGTVVQRMFADVTADVYVMVDGDDTYDPSIAPMAIERLVTDGLDLVNVARLYADEAVTRPSHLAGNRLIQRAVSRLFGQPVGDLLSGYKIMSRRFAKSFPSLSTGFEIETELTVFALELRLPWAEMSALYKSRPAGSASKLHTLRDGWRIGLTILRLYKHEHPAKLFGSVAFILVAFALGLGVPVIVHYLYTGMVPRLPTAVLASSLVVLAALNLAIGIILDTVTRGRQEQRRMNYLNHDVTA